MRPEKSAFNNQVAGEPSATRVRPIAMLLLLPNFGFLDTLNVPDDAGLKDDYQVDECAQ